MDENRQLTRDLQAAIEENTAMAEKALLAERNADKLKRMFEGLYQQAGDTMQVMNRSVAVNEEEMGHVRDLQSRIMDLQVSLVKGREVSRLVRWIR